MASPLPGTFRFANKMFEIWIAMENQYDYKLEWNGEKYIVLRSLVSTLQHVEVCVCGLLYPFKVDRFWGAVA